MLLSLNFCGCSDQVQPSSAKQLAQFEKAGPVHPTAQMDQLIKAKTRRGAYRVMPGEVIELTMPAILQVVTAEEEGGVGEVAPYMCRVSEMGTITLPVVGEIQVVGMTLIQIETAVIEAYYPKYAVSRPSVFARLVERVEQLPFTVIGLVNRPGSFEYPYDVQYNLMQAIARVNRVFKGKQGGLIVDYIGIASELKRALKNYTDAKGRGEPTLRAEEAYSVLLEKIDVVRGLFHGFDYSDFENKAYKLLVPAANHVLGLDDGKKRFLDGVLAINKAYSLCGTLDEAKELRAEIAFFSAIKAAISKFTYVDKKRIQEDKNSALKQILDNAVIAEGVADVFALAGLDKPNIGLLSEEFLEDVRNMPHRNLAVELLEKLLKDEIRSKTRNNVVQEMKYGERLKETLRKYNNRAIETAQVIEELIQMAKEFQEALNRDAELGLQPDEVAFYDALANNESAVRELGDEILKKIAIEITEKLRKSTTVDWQVRDSVRAKLRILVRRTLQRYKYPPDMAAEAVELVLKQAEVLSNAWTH